MNDTFGFLVFVFCIAIVVAAPNWLTFVVGLLSAVVAWSRGGFISLAAFAIVFGVIIYGASSGRKVGRKLTDGSSELRIISAVIVLVIGVCVALYHALVR